MKLLCYPQVLQLSSKEGETFRFVPDPNQIRNAYEVFDFLFAIAESYVICKV